LDVTFTPTTTGPQQATLTIGLLTYPLQGTGVAPPPPVFPAPSIQLTLATPGSAQQGSLSVSLASASTASGSGTVTLAFQCQRSLVPKCGDPTVTVPCDDPTVTFADGTRSATFTVAEGASTGQFAGGSSVSFGTGTSAGTLVFTVTLGSNTAQANVTIPPALVAINAAVAASNVECDPALVYCTPTNIQLQINGWDNTWDNTQPTSANQIVFNFFDSSGNQISPHNITVDETTAFQSYFQCSDLGGVFGLTAFFPVIEGSGVVATVATAVVQIFNSECTMAQSNENPPVCIVPTTTITF
jgi:hypothetical protein